MYVFRSLINLLFRVFDINNDGSISLKELKRIVKERGPTLQLKKHKKLIIFKNTINNI